MSELEPEKPQANVTLTLDPLGADLPGITGKEFPCPVCGAGLPILLSKTKKPYCTCNSCGIQLFIRGKLGISRLRKLMLFGNLISSRGESASYGITLLNRLEQLKLQKRDLFIRRALFFTDPNVQNAMDLVDAELKSVQRELAKIARAKRKESEK